MAPNDVMHANFRNSDGMTAKTEPIVWQHNKLAEARYELTLREQRLLMYVISMIEPGDEDFKRYIIDIKHFAELTNVSTDDLYTELKQVAMSLKSKLLIIPDHYDDVTGKKINLMTNWLGDVYTDMYKGEGYFAVDVSRNLAPYLINVKREFFQFPLKQLIQLKRSYAVRLYQYLIRSMFKETIVISLDDLRYAMGVVVYNDKTKDYVSNLSNYADFKKRALIPAVEEINNDCNISVEYKELKLGARKVQAIQFIATSKGEAQIKIEDSPGSSKGDESPAGSQPAGSSESDNNDPVRVVSICKAKYGLTEAQAIAVMKYINEKGVGYISEKQAIVDAIEKNPNKAGYFMTALVKNWQPKKSASSKPKQERKPSATANLPTPEDLAASVKWEARKVELRAEWDAATIAMRETWLNYQRMRFVKIPFANANGESLSEPFLQTLNAVFKEGDATLGDEQMGFAI